MATFPPLHTTPSTPITPSAAESLLSTYLTLSLTSPHLLPSAQLSNLGPSALTDSTSNLTLHNLRRVVAGLKGEWLAPSLDEELDQGISGVGESDATSALNNNGSAGPGGIESSEWQDLDDYQKAQSDIEGEIGDRMLGADNSMVVEDPADVRVVVAGSGEKRRLEISKEERRAAKKARIREAEKKKQRERSMPGKGVVEEETDSD